MEQAGSTVVVKDRTSGVRKRQRNIRRWLVAAAIAGLFIWRLTRNPDTLLVRSLRLPTSDFRIYGWVGDRYLLAYGPLPMGNAEAFLIDVQSGMRKALPALTRSVISAPIDCYPWATRSKVSPDGRWFLWGTVDIGGRIKSHVFATALDGTRTVEWKDAIPSREGYTRIWLPDSNRWMRSVLRSPDGRASQTVEIQELSVSDSQYLRRWHARTPMPSVSGWTEPDTLVSEPEYVTTPRTEVRLQMLRIADGAVVARSCNILMPEKCEATCSATSADGRRLFLTTFQANHNLWTDTMRLSTFVGHWDSWLTFWVCAPDGSGLTEIGRFRGLEQSDGEDKYTFIGPSPSGDKIAFEFRGALYIAPVPKLVRDR